MLKQNYILLLFFVFISYKTLSISHSKTTQDLYLVLLIDASSSMQQTDPDEYRKMASQAIAALVAPTDRIAVVQFASTATLLSDWTQANNVRNLFEAIDKVEHSGNTDLLEGFNLALNLLKNAPDNARKAILLFSDGELYPNPTSSLYYPLNNEWKVRSFGLSQQGKQLLFEREYKSKYAGIAKSRIEEEVLIRLKNDSVEIFSIGFSTEVDRHYLEYLCGKVTLSPTESRFFYVENPTDLTESFVKLLPYWHNKVILYKKQISLSDYNEGEIFIDEFTRDVVCIAVFDKQNSITIAPSGGENERRIEGTHPLISIMPLKGDNLPNTWKYSITGDGGRCMILVVGESTIRIDVDNLKPNYITGESLNVGVRVMVGDNDARTLLNSKPIVVADLLRNEVFIESLTLTETSSGFVLNYPLVQTGNYKLRFTLNALDKKGKEMLPRPSREFKFEVFPRFYIKPSHINFGTVKNGSEKLFSILVNNGFSEARKAIVSSKIVKLSRDTKDDYFPHIEGELFVLEGESKEHHLKVIVPDSKNWGFYNGEIEVTTNKGEKQVLTFELHVPNWREKVGYVVVPLFVLLLVFLVYLLYRWSNLKTPIGILRPIKYPSGTILDDIRLSRVKRGFWSKHLNWKKNEVKIGAIKSNIKLNDLPLDSNIKLLFFRFGRDYVVNESPKESDFEIKIVDQDVGIRISIYPGKSYSLSNGMKIEMGDYTFLYELT